MATVSTSDEVVRLTATERRLLTCLVSNAGRIVSHRELLEAMSSGNRNIKIGNLRSCISRLRNKIEIDPALARVIITHHKLGYSFAGKDGARLNHDGGPRPGTVTISGLVTGLTSRSSFRNHSGGAVVMGAA